MTGKAQTLKADLHLHTNECPRDSSIQYNARQLIDTAAGHGYDVLAITNHDMVTWDTDLRDYAADRDILLIPGIELTVNHKHVLVYNADVRSGPLDSFEQLRGLKTPDSLMIAPHPFYPGSHSLRSRLFRWRSLFDAVELCHFYTNWIGFNRRAVQAACMLDLPLVGTSDTHCLQQLGTTHTVIYAEKTISGVIEAVKQGNIDVMSRPLSTPHMLSIAGTVFLNQPAKQAAAACLYLFSLMWR